VSYPERIDPDGEAPGVVAIHLSRYSFARPYCSGKRVLDAACGLGYGTAHLGEGAASALGVDADRDAIAIAERRYASESVSFEVMDVTALALADSCFDVVCSFETVEHVEEPERAIAEAARVLAGGGSYLVSTPNVAATNHRPANPFHRVELSAGDFHALLREYFARVELLGQRRLESRRHRLARRLDVGGVRRRSSALRLAGSRLTGSSPVELLSDREIVFDGDLRHAQTLFAVCTGPR
jgi:SAM-dependent methyltransferase